MDEFLQSSPPASGDEQPVSHGGMACRHRQDRGGKDWICRFAWTTQTRCPHTHSRLKRSSRKLLDLKDKGRRDYTLTSAIPGPSSGVHFSVGCCGSRFSAEGLFQASPPMSM